MREFLVWSALFYLRFWARAVLRFNRPYIIGVAGSVGKSSTRNALAAVLKEHFPTKVVSGNSETGVPLGIMGLEMKGFTAKDWISVCLRAPLRLKNMKGVKYLIVEMGIDDPYPPKNMSYLLTIVTPDMSIDLNATATHTMQFEKVLKKHTKDSLEFILGKIAQEDSKIITNGYTKIGIYNKDDSRLSEIIEKNAKNSEVTLLTFGSDKQNSIIFVDYTITSKKTKFSYLVPSSNTSGKRPLELSFPGFLLPPASRESFAAVLLAGHSIGLKFSRVKEALEKNFSLPKGRSSLLPGIRNSLIIDSSYNSSKSTVLSFLDMLKILKKRTGRPIVMLMGDMRELGNESKAEHEEVANAIVNVVDVLYCVGPQTREFVMPIVKEKFMKKRGGRRAIWFKNAVQAGLQLKEELPENAIVLVKGSQNTIYLEEAVKFLLENQTDVKKLTRQSEFWLKTKQSFFSI